jgi:hypothetical protein
VTSTEEWMELLDYCKFGGDILVANSRDHKSRAETVWRCDRCERKVQQAIGIIRRGQGRFRGEAKGISQQFLIVLSGRVCPSPVDGGVAR